MLFLRIFVPPDRTEATLAALRGRHGVDSLVHLPGAGAEGGDDLITASLDPVVANEVIEVLRSLRLDRPGAVTLVRQERTELLPGSGTLGRPTKDDAADRGFWDASADAVVIDEVIDEAHENARLSLTYLLLMAAAGAVAGVGVGQDSSVLIVGAMAISPDLMPLSAICVGLVARERRTTLVGASSLLLGLLVAAFVAGLLVRLADLAGVLRADLGENVLTAFVTEPSAAGVVVALAAGVAAMISIERQASSAVGVAISVTTIPAAAAIGVALGLGDWSRMASAALVLGLNLVSLAVAGSLTLWMQVRRGHAQRSSLPPVRQ